MIDDKESFKTRGQGEVLHVLSEGALLQPVVGKRIF